MTVQNIVAGLKQIAQLANSSSEVVKFEEVIRALRVQLKDFEAEPRLKNLEEVLSVWELKLPVILKEPVGRQGMAKHALYWVEQLKNVR